MKNASGVNSLSFHKIWTIFMKTAFGRLKYYFVLIKSIEVQNYLNSGTSGNMYCLPANANEAVAIRDLFRKFYLSLNEHFFHGAKVPRLDFIEVNAIAE